MKIRKDIKLEKIVSKDETRFAIAAPAVQEIRGQYYLCATDGKRLLAVPVEMEKGDMAGYIPLAALDAAKKAAYKNNDFAVLSANGDVKVTAPEGEMMFKRNPGEATFPNISHIIPAADRKEFKVSFNAAALAELVKAAGPAWGNDITLRISESNLDPIRVEIHAKRDFIALIMPVQDR